MSLRLVECAGERIPMRNPTRWHHCVLSVAPTVSAPFVAGFFDEISMHVQDFCRFDIVLPAVMFLTAKIVPFPHIAKPLIWCPVRPRTGALESVSLGSSSLDSLESFLWNSSARGFCHGNLRVEIHFANLIVVWILSNSRRIVYWSLLPLRWSGDGARRWRCDDEVADERLLIDIKSYE